MKWYQQRPPKGVRHGVPRKEGSQLFLSLSPLGNSSWVWVDRQTPQGPIGWLLLISLLLQVSGVHQIGRM